MNITIYLNNGQTLSADVSEYNAAEFTQALNNPQILVVNIGDVIINKHALLMVAPSNVS